MRYANCLDKHYSASVMTAELRILNTAIPSSNVADNDVRVSERRDFDISVSLEGVISIRDRKPRCKRDIAGKPCKREAAWRVDFHGCSSGLMCNECLEVWRKQAAPQFAGGGSVPCKWCGRTFASLDEALTVVPL